MNKRNEDKSTKKKKLVLPIVMMAIAWGGIFSSILVGFNWCMPEMARYPALIGLIVCPLMYLIGAVLLIRNLLNNNSNGLSVLAKSTLIIVATLFVDILVSLLILNLFAAAGIYLTCPA